MLEQLCQKEGKKMIIVHNHFFSSGIAYKSVSRLGTTSTSFAWFRGNVIVEKAYAREQAL